MGTGPGRAYVIGTVIPIIGAGCAVREVGVGADSGGTHIVRTLVAIVRTRRAVRLVITLANPCTVTSIRKSAIVGGRIAAGRAGRQIRMGTGPSRAHVVRAIIPIIGARCAVRLVVRLTNARAVAGIRRRAVVRRRITAGCTRR